MRDFRDAKAMAHALRDGLKSKAVQTTHSECLELIAKAFGYENWNILAAKIDAVEPRQGAAHSSTQHATGDKTLHCSFCGKSQHDVRKLVAGPGVYICDKCVDLCTDMVDEQLLRLMEGDAQAASAMSTERLLHYMEHASSAEQRNRLALERVEQLLALRENAEPADDSVLTSADFIHLKSRTTEELLAIQKHSQDQLRRYQQAVRTAKPVLDRRKE
jgi:hypothetical protein